MRERDEQARLLDRFAQTITEKCGSLAAADLLAAAGLRYGVHEIPCAALGVPDAGSLPEITECLRRHHTCRDDQLLEREAPRSRELLDLGGVP